MAPTTSPRFNDPLADICLLSKPDNIQFLVRSVYLYQSVVFEDMLSVGHDLKTAKPDYELVTVELEDLADDLDVLLSFMVRGSMFPEMEGVSQLQRALAIADKYDVQVATQVLAIKLETFTKAHPVQGFALAVTYRQPDIAKAALRLFKPSSKKATFKECDKCGLNNCGRSCSGTYQDKIRNVQDISLSWVPKSMFFLLPAADVYRFEEFRVAVARREKTWDEVADAW